MGDYIDRENYCKTICRCDRDYCDKGKCPIWTAPSADVRPVVRGRWKYFHKQNKAVCTVCSFERDLDQNFGKAIACPNCGTNMKEDDEV